MAENYCLKCGTMNAGMTCSACGNELRTPESHPVPQATASPIGMITYAVCGLLVLVQLMIIVAALIGGFGEHEVKASVKAAEREKAEAAEKK